MASHSPFGLKAQRGRSEAVLRPAPRNDGGGAALQGPERKEARIPRVRQLEALQRVGDGGGREPLELELSQGEELAGFCPESLRLGVPARGLGTTPERGHDAEPEGEDGDHRPHHQSPPPSPSSRQPRRGLAERLLRRREPTRVALPPQGEVTVRGPRPEQVLGTAPVLPGLGRLAELVAEQGAVFVLGLPAHQPRPGPEQRLVDDLHVPAALALFVPGPLVRSQEPGVDQGVEDLRSRPCGSTSAFPHPQERASSPAPALAAEVSPRTPRAAPLGPARPACPGR